MLGTNALPTRLLALGWLSRLAVAQSSTATFLYPPIATGVTGSQSTIIMNVVDTVVVEYTSNFQDAWLWVWCKGAAGSYSRWANKEAPTNGTINYSPSLDSDINRSFVQAYSCHFDLMYENKDLSAVNGPIFSITSVGNLASATFKREVTPTNLPSSRSASLSTSSFATATSSSSATASTPSATNSSLPPPPESDSGTSPGAKAGIAVGVVAGIGAVLGLGFLAWRRKRKSQSRVSDDGMEQYAKPHGVEVAPSYQDDVAHSGYAMGSTKYAMEADQGRPVHRKRSPSPVEMDPVHPLHELPGSSVSK